MANLRSDTTVGGVQAATLADIQNTPVNYGVATGSSNAYVIAYTPTITTLTAGMLLKFKANHSNTGSATLNVDGIGAVTIKKLGNTTNLTAEDILNGQIVTVIYDGTYFQLINVAQTNNIDTIISQSTHGFAVGNILRWDVGTNSYVKAIATTREYSASIGIVSEVITADIFKLTTTGYVGNLSGLTSESQYYLSDTVAGELSIAEPVTEGYISKPLFFTNSTTSGFYTNNYGTVIGSLPYDVNMNTHKLKNLSVPSTAGDSIRATAKITEALLESATDLKHTQNTDTGTTGNSFAVGDGTGSSDKKIIAQNADVNKPYLSYDEATNSWVFSNDGSAETQMAGAGAVTYAVAAEIVTGTVNNKVIAPDQLKLAGIIPANYATAAEITTGTEAAKAIAPDQLKLAGIIPANFATAAEIIAGTEAGKAIAPDQLAASHVGVPSGAEMLWPSETVPEGWLEEDGSSLVRATYPALFAAIGTMYGTADATHFNLPDARGIFPRIWAHGQTTDPDRATRTAPTATGATISAGDHVGTSQADEIKSHTHPSVTQPATGTTGGNYWLTNSGGNTGTTGGNETRPINTYRMMIIKAY